MTKDADNIRVIGCRGQRQISNEIASPALRGRNDEYPLYRNSAGTATSTGNSSAGAAPTKPLIKPPRKPGKALIIPSPTLCPEGTSLRITGVVNTGGLDGMTSWISLAPRSKTESKKF